MNYDIKKLKNSELEIKFTIEADKMQTFIDQSVEELSRDLKVPGFRPGHIPPHVVTEKLGTTTINARAQEAAIQKTYVDMVIKENLNVIARPKITVDTQEPFSFTAVVAILPEAEIKGYESIKVKVEEAKLSDKEIKDTIDNIKKGHTDYEETDQEAKLKDKVELDFEGFEKDGTALENTKSENHPVVLGEGMLVPGFEENIVGMKAGEEKEFDVTFPKDYFKKDFQGKKVKFKSKLHKVSVAKVPELDEALIEKITGKKMKVDEFQKELEENLSKQKEVNNRQSAENKYIEELIKKVEVEIPDALKEDELNFVVQEMKGDAEKKGVKFEDFLKNTGKTEESLREQFAPEAEKRIKARLALRKAIEMEEIKVEDKDVMDELAKIKSFYPETEHSKIQKDFEEKDLRAQITNRLTLNKFFDKILST